jgi:hypothetical protein
LYFDEKEKLKFNKPFCLNSLKILTHMKKVITLLLLSSVWLTNAQAFKGNGDVKGQVGLNLQDGGTGIFFLLILNW